jgi:hypothetical protein
VSAIDARAMKTLWQSLPLVAKPHVRGHGRPTGTSSRGPDDLVTISCKVSSAAHRSAVMTL